MPDKSLYNQLYKNLDKMPTWANFFNKKSTQSLISYISSQLDAEVAQGTTISPSYEDVFRAFMATPLDKIKCVIVGQDPAPEPDLATGLSFSIAKGISTARVPSIQRVLLEMRNEDFKVDILNGDLSPLASRGVLLLNTVLTIPIPKGQKEGVIDGHKELWMPFTRSLFSYFADDHKNFSFILWGSQAGSFARHISMADHLIITGGHPSPTEPGNKFFCRKYFLKTNEYLVSKRRGAIDWNLTNQEPADKRKGIWGWDHVNKVSVYDGACPLNIVD